MLNRKTTTYQREIKVICSEKPKIHLQPEAHTFRGVYAHAIMAMKLTICL